MKKPSIVCLQDQVLQDGEVKVEEALLEGHLGVTRELLAFQSAEKKYHIGSEKGNASLIKVCNRFKGKVGDKQKGK